MLYKYKKSLCFCLLLSLVTFVANANPGKDVRKKLLDNFNKLDVDKSESLSFQELGVISAKLSVEKQTRFSKFMKFLDKDSNQEINKMELQSQSKNKLEFKSNKTHTKSKETTLADNAYLDVTYGEHERNKLDIWLAKSEEATPLVIYIHGGGFKGGDKAKGLLYRDDFLKAGISFAAINYRFLPQSKNGIFGCFNDSKRALQYISSKSDQWNLDRSRFALCGGSAGAGTSLWLAYKDDMADPTSKDPVLRESTRVSAVAVTATQCTYNFKKWFSLFETEPQPGAERVLASFYGLKVADLKSEKGKRHIQDADLLIHISKDDPPLFARNHMRGGKVDINDQNHINHHPLHVKALKERAMEVGLRHQCHAKAIGIDDKPEDNSFQNFLIRELSK